MPKLASPPVHQSQAQPNPEVQAERPHGRSRYFLGQLNLANSLSLAGLCAAVLGCLLAFQDKLGPALVALIAAGLFDLFDGLAARRTERAPVEARFGAELDSLVDMASFGVAPIVIAMHAGLDGVLDLAIFAAYGCAAATRLAHFNSHRSPAQPVASFTGLPVTFAALLFPFAFVAADMCAPPASQVVIRSTFSLVALAFVTRFNCPKPRGLFYVVLPLVAVAMSTYLLTGFGTR